MISRMDMDIDMRVEDGRKDSLGNLFRELRDESTRLFRQEMALAKAELTDKAKRTGRNLVIGAVGAGAALFGALFLLGAICAAIYSGFRALDMPNGVALWLAPLLLAVGLGIAGYVMIQKCIRTLKHETPVPEKTVQTLQEDKQWLKSKIRS